MYTAPAARWVGSLGNWINPSKDFGKGTNKLQSKEKDGKGLDLG